MTTPFDFLRSRTIWYFALIFAIYLFTGCDNFWVACTEAGVVCTTLADAGSTEDGTVVIPPDPNKPIGPTRKFEEKAFIKVDPNKLKYVGMKGTTPVFLANEDKSVSPNLPFRWVAYQLDLLKEKEEERSTLDMNRIGFPAAPDNDFVNTPILVSGGYFYGLFPKESRSALWSRARNFTPSRSCPTAHHMCTSGIPRSLDSPFQPSQRS